MLYVVTYNIKGIYGPGGTLLRLGMKLSELPGRWRKWLWTKWMTPYPFMSGSILMEMKDNRESSSVNNLEEVKHIIGQISDTMKSEDFGYIDFWEYGDVFELIEGQQVSSWCSEALENQIAQAKKSYFALLNQLSYEWEGV